MLHAKFCYRVLDAGWISAQLLVGFLFLELLNYLSCVIVEERILKHASSVGVFVKFEDVH